MVSEMENGGVVAIIMMVLHVRDYFDDLLMMKMTMALAMLLMLILTL